VNPILNVTDLAASFGWFDRLGFPKAWSWGEPATFGAVRNGEVEIFLCEGAQGAPGTWMSIWVDDVDGLHRHCLAGGITVGMPPTDCPWNVREMHVVHPDGHTFRFSQASPHDHEHGHDHEPGHDHGHGPDHDHPHRH
jgi:hypothetical protein